MIAIVKADFNKDITDSLLKGCTSYLAQENLVFQVFDVPGAVETVGLTGRLLASQSFEAIIVLGAVIQGDTDHYTYVCQYVTSGLSSLSTQADIPVIFGILTTKTEEQALERADVNRQNLGGSYAATAIRMTGVFRALKQS
ncbi:MAG: hypothetical protein RIQ34_1419 [Bacteroidota bacterium]|jgi:6,7-dimethyl-8-ribityllumazine synthase